MTTFKLSVAYDGTELSGWQIQPGRETVQGMIERSLAKCTGQRVAVVGSGRTDAGVHAIAQIASCSIPRWSGTAENLRRAINVNLPSSILITKAQVATDDFHAQRDATSKRYRYQIQNGGDRDPLNHRYWYRLRKPVDIALVRDAASRLVGTHDFASFQATGAERKSTTRTLSHCEVIDLPAGPFDAPRFAIEVESNGFLYNMVRNIVGTVLEVGAQKQPPHWIEQVVEARDRNIAGPTAPACGLFLKEVHYPAQ